MEVLEKHKTEKFLVPVSDQHKKEIPELISEHKLKYSIAILYLTVSSDLTDLSMINYDVLVFFSPSGIKSLFKNFPEFKQNDTKIASFGNSTARAVQEAGLRLDLQAPMPNAPSMTMALDMFIKENNKNIKKEKVE
jgi:uroporphyrinogen-III synthase